MKRFFVVDKEFIFLLPLIAGIFWSVFDLCTAAGRGWGTVILPVGLLAVLLCSVRWSEKPGLLAAAGVCFLLGSIVLTTCAYIMTDPPQQKDLRVEEGTVASFTRGIRNRSGSRDCILYLEGDNTRYWISSTVSRKRAVSVSPGDFVRFSYADKADGSRSIYGLEVYGAPVLEEENSLRLAKRNHNQTLFFLLFTLEGFNLLCMSSQAAKDKQRRPRTSRRGKRRK